MYKVKNQPVCTHCGSEDISENLLMKCNCTKGMGRNLSYPKFICRDCQTNFGDKKNDKSREVVKIEGQEWTLEKTDKGGALSLEKDENSIQPKSLSKRQWKGLMEKVFNEIYMLEWSLEEAPGESFKIHLQDGQIITVTSSLDHPYYKQLNHLINSI